MKTRSCIRLGSLRGRIACALVVLLAAAGGDLAAQGLPQASRDNIHKLFDNHSAVTRTVTMTDTGYVALTESDDPGIAKTLRSHVAQMQERLESGLAVRRWDPAYDEMVRHYKDLDLKVEATEKGLRVVMTGKTPAAVKVAQNHAKIVSQFIARGWDEHDVRHPAVANDSAASTSSESAPAAACCNAGKCCRNASEGGKKSPSPD
jgi:hypothetical protein